MSLLLAERLQAAAHLLTSTQFSKLTWVAQQPTVTFSNMHAVLVLALQVVTAWNGMSISAFSRAARVLAAVEQHPPTAAFPVEGEQAMWDVPHSNDHMHHVSHLPLIGVCMQASMYACIHAKNVAATGKHNDGVCSG
jgi:hypothetical protein